MVRDAVDGMSGPGSVFLTWTGPTLYPESGTGAMMVEFGVRHTSPAYMDQEVTVQMRSGAGMLLDVRMRSFCHGRLLVRTLLLSDMPSPLHNHAR
jgi:hypothetical protein